MGIAGIALQKERGALAAPRKEASALPAPQTKTQAGFFLFAIACVHLTVLNRVSVSARTGSEAVIPNDAIVRCPDHSQQGVQEIELLGGGEKANKACRAG